MADYPTVLPRIFVEDPQAVVGFLKDVFGATGEVQDGRPTEVSLGDAVILVSSTEARGPFPGFLYVYVADVDSTYQRAVDAGAETLEEPLDTPYGDRRAMVRDREGNIFQIAHR